MAISADPVVFEFFRYKAPLLGRKTPTVSELKVKVGVLVGFFVLVGVGVSVFVGVRVAVGVRVFVGVRVTVGVSVIVGVGVSVGAVGGVTSLPIP